MRVAILDALVHSAGMKHTFDIQVLSAEGQHYCDETSEDVHIWGPIEVRRSMVVLVELKRPVPSAVLAPFIARALSRCEIKQAQLFDERIPFTVENLQRVLSRQSNLGA